MGGLFGSLVFSNPWALTALLGLPALYLLLKITPPAPHILKLPTAKFLNDLKPKHNTPSHTPWSILLLRLMIAALIILSIADPVLNPNTKAGTRGNLLIAIDNGWSAAQNWDDIQNAALQAIELHSSDRASVYILPSAERSSENLKAHTKTQAMAFIRALKPQPWRGRFEAIENAPNFNDVLYFSDGLEKGGLRNLNGFGDIAVFSPSAQDLPYLLQKDERNSSRDRIVIDRPSGVDAAAKPLVVQALGSDGNLLDEQRFESGAEFPLSVVFDLEQADLHNVQGYRIAGVRGVNARYDLDGSGGPKSVGIVAGGENSGRVQRYTEDSFYLGKALEPFASVQTGALEDILETPPSLIILPDIASMPEASLNALTEYVENGGVLLRFAGPNMTQAGVQEALLPVPLRRAQRNVDGAITWEKPLHLKEIPPESPLYGLEIDPNIEIKGQILPDLNGAEPSRIWATLEDDTPLITAAPRGDGLLVFVHTSASPAWSNLPLSGFYVQLLKRLLKFSGQGATSLPSAEGTLMPTQVFDGFGTLQSPSPTVRPVDAKEFDTLEPSPEHPPGFYGQGAFSRSFNLGDGLNMPRALESLNIFEGALQAYTKSEQKSLAPLLLSFALLLLILDGLVMLYVSRAYASILDFKRPKFPLGLFLIAMVLSAPSYAQQDAPVAAQDFYLAYIKTGNAQLDTTSEKGLGVLAAALNIRTSAEPKGVLGVDLETDTLAYFPILYWPLSANQAELSETALRNLQHYMDQGGSVFIDTRGEDTRRILQTHLAGLNIPPLRKISKNHVITRSFYLIDAFPGRLTGADFWVVDQSLSESDGVSPIIIGNHDWAGGWSELNVITRGSGQYTRQYIAGLNDQQETSLRFGVNLIMYALTGNYKTDQVHVTTILERLGTGRPRGFQRQGAP